jgi:hypothetical protein
MVKERPKAKAARTFETLEAKLNQLSTPSPQGMLEAGSGTPIMLYTDPKFALVQHWAAIEREVLPIGACSLPMP